MRPFLHIASLFLTLACWPTHANAQVIRGGESERGLGPGVYVPYEGIPYTQRYAYTTGSSFLFLNGNGRDLWYLDYLDRADRADKFGYREPQDPFLRPAQGTTTTVRPRFGLGLGLFRR